MKKVAIQALIVVVMTTSCASIPTGTTPAGQTSEPAWLVALQVAVIGALTYAVVKNAGKKSEATATVINN